MDLLYRLRVLAIEVPPLRDRQEDISPLALHFLLRFAEQQRKRVRDLGPKVLDELGRYDWPETSASWPTSWRRRSASRRRTWTCSIASPRVSSAVSARPESRRRASGAR